MALTIITNSVTSINTNTATCGGNIILGTVTGTITAKGVCWSTSANPTTALSTITSDGAGSSNFTSLLTSLTSGTTYYVRAYVTETISNTSTTYYGANVVFTTLGLTTTAVTSITSTTAISGATSVNGFTSISAVGVCWNTSGSSPTISNNITSDILIGNSFTSNITGLLAGTTYNVRSYVTSNGLTYYGNQITFTTLSTNPVVTTNSNITDISLNGASVSGNVSSTGGANVNVTERGIRRSLFSTMNSSTDVPSTNVPSGNGTGTFTSVITNLSNGTTYYVQAYATNNNGTSYGAIYNFTTLGGATIETITPYSIKASSAISGCKIINLNGGSIIERGICIGVYPNPTITNSLVVLDAYPGNTNNYLVLLQNLTPGTTYHIRAYAKTNISNTTLTAYGDNKSFDTVYCEESCITINNTIECNEPVCEYNIPSGCVYFDKNITCSTPYYTNVTHDIIVNVNDSEKVENNNLNEIYTNLNNQFCYIYSKAFIKEFLTLIKNNEELKIIFCQIKALCLNN